MGRSPGLPLRERAQPVEEEEEEEGERERDTEGTSFMVRHQGMTHGFLNRRAG